MPNIQFNLVSLTDCTSDIVITTNYTVEVNAPLLVEVIADSGYYFQSPPYITNKNTIGETFSTYLVSDDVGEYKTNYYYEIDYDWLYNNFYNSNLGTWSSITKFKLYGVSQIAPEVDRYGIINIYNPTPSQLKDISNVRYVTGQGDTVDLGNFITNLIKVFVEIPIGDSANCVLGGYDTSVSCNVIVNEIIETDCGSVEITGHYDNAMDYENTSIEIFLPLIGFQTLEPSKVMNETLSLIYKTNVINGDTIACIYNTDNDLIYTFTSNGGFEIPYRLNDEITANGEVGVNTNYLYGFTPFVYVRYNMSYNVTTMSSDNREVTLNTLTGYVKCSEVFNTINAITSEKDEIDMLLKSGVIIT